MLRAEVDRLKKENQALRSMIEAVKSKCKMLHDRLDEAMKSDHDARNQRNETPSRQDHKKKAKVVEVTVAKASQIFVRTALDDQSLVSHQTKTKERICSIGSG